MKLIYFHRALYFYLFEDVHRLKKLFLLKNYAMIGSVQKTFLLNTHLAHFLQVISKHYCYVSSGLMCVLINIFKGVDNMETSQVSVLLIEDNYVEGMLIQTALAGAEGNPYRVEWVTRLADALFRLRHKDEHRFGNIDVILLNLTLSDDLGVNVFDQVYAWAGNAMIFVLQTCKEEPQARRAKSRSPHGFLYKGSADAYVLPRALRHVVELKALRVQLQKAESALKLEKECAECAHVALSSISDAVLITDVRGSLTFMNVAAEVLTGWSLEEALDKPVTEVFKIINSISRQPIKNIALQAIQLCSKVELDANAVLLQREGKEIAIEHSAEPLCGKNGQLIGAVTVFYDVTKPPVIQQKMAHIA